MEQGPTTTSRRPSRPFRMSDTRARDSETVRAEESVIGISRANSAGETSGSSAVMRRLLVRIMIFRQHTPAAGNVASGRTPDYNPYSDPRHRFPKPRLG
jgi:hypothetical protein